MEEVFDKYLLAIVSEMKRYKGIKADTVFVGGGTPTVLDSGQLERLVGDIKNNFKLSSECEFSIEANPGTLNREKAEVLKNCGVNRISVGVQSFADNELFALGRIHSAKEAYDTVNMIYDTGIKNINIDLMTSVPHQTKESLLKNLETAFSLPVTHISAYSLMLEEGTPLLGEYQSGEFSLIDDDTDRKMFDALKTKMSENGFLRYEISNFAKAGYQSRHNINYWDAGEYIGLGLAAHSYFNGERFSNTEDMDSYLTLDFESGDRKKLSKNDMMSEFMMLGLRMTRGVSVSEFKRRFGTDIENIYGKEIKKFTELGLMEYADGYYRLSDRGLDISNQIMCEFLI